MNRPTGVTIIALLYFFSAAMMLLGGCMFLALPLLTGAGALGQEGAGEAIAISGTMGVIFCGVFAIFALLAAFFGWGLWKLKNWARILTIVFSIPGLLGIPIGTIISGLIIWYLLKEDVKVAFQ
ncbi:MAG: hypothetical protein HY871_02115 [Chloroflexi bacterium]|nr:hypothetical protein [Chloroflexota bacterium]